MNGEGAAVAFASLAIIAAYHPLVIKAEYYFSKKIWPLFAVCGLGGLAASLFLKGAAAPVAAVWAAFRQIFVPVKVHATCAALTRAAVNLDVVDEIGHEGG